MYTHTITHNHTHTHTAHTQYHTHKHTHTCVCVGGSLLRGMRKIAHELAHEVTKKFFFKKQETSWHHVRVQYCGALTSR